MKAARIFAGELRNRSPAAVADQKNGAVAGTRRRDRCVLVENLPAVQFDDVVVLLDVGIERLQGQILEALHARGRIRVNANSVPGLQDLSAKVKHLPGAGPK